jgi:hypothetical protein
MKTCLSKEFVLVIGFLGIIAAPGIIQTRLELSRDGTLQAFNVFRQKPTATNLRTYEKEMEEASWVAEQLRPVIQYAQFNWLREGGDKAICGADGWMFYRPGVQYLTERTAATTPGLNDPLAAILAFRDELAKRQIHLLILVAPNKESIYPEKLTRRAKGLEVVVCAPTRRLLAELRQAGLVVVDLFETFRQAKRNPQLNTGTPLYLAQDSHWSPMGLALAANTVARTILDRGWVQRGNVAYDTSPSPVRRLGDIIRMLQVPKIERETLPELVPCRQIIRIDTQQPYLDDPDAEILVLGDSYLRIYEQDEPRSAGFVAHLARELGQPVASIINDGGASTLVRQELNRRPRLLANKRLVIWEFVERDIRLGIEGWQVVPVPPAMGASPPRALAPAYGSAP